MSKHGFSLILICPYMERICNSVYIRGNTDMILIQTEKLGLFCWKLRGGVYFGLPSRKVTASGVPLIVVTTILSFSRLNKCFFSHGRSNVDAWSEVSSTLSVAYLGPIKHLRCSFLQKILKILKSLNILVKSTILYVWWSPKCLIETSYKLGLMLCQTIIHTNFENICILWYTPSIMY